MSNNGLLSLNTKQDIQPEKIFDLKEKLGEGSYGSVYKAVHKASNSLVAIKKVPLDSDLQVNPKYTQEMYTPTKSKSQCYTKTKILAFAFPALHILQSRPL